MKILHPVFNMIDRENGHNGFIEYSFDNGKRKGNYHIDYEIFPLTKKDFNTLFRDTITPEAANELAGYFKRYLAYLDTLHINDNAGQEKARHETEKKRYIAMLECLNDIYPDIQVAEMKKPIKVKKDEFYTSKKDGIVLVEGVIFEKDGYMFGAYKDSKYRKCVYIVDLLTGCCVKAYSGSVRNAPHYLNEMCMKMFSSFINGKTTNTDGQTYNDMTKALKDFFTENGITIPDYITANEPFQEIPEQPIPGIDTIANTGKEDAMQEKALADAPIEKSDCKPDHRYNKPYILYVFRDGKITPIRHAKTVQKSPTSRKVYITIPCNAKSRYKAKYKLCARRISGRWILQAGGSQKQTVSGKSPPNKSSVYEKIRMENRNGKSPPVTIDHGG